MLQSPTGQRLQTHQRKDLSAYNQVYLDVETWGRPGRVLRGKVVVGYLFDRVSARYHESTTTD